MRGHLSGFVQLVGIQELDCKPGEILGHLFTVQPSAQVPGEERCFITSLLFHMPRVGLLSEGSRLGGGSWTEGVRMLVLLFVLGQQEPPGNPQCQINGQILAYSLLGLQDPSWMQTLMPKSHVNPTQRPEHRSERMWLGARTTKYPQGLQAPLQPSVS